MKTEYKKLELDKILEFLSGEAWSELVKERARAVEPLYGIDEIRRELEKTDAAFILASKYGTPRFYNMRDVSSAIRRAGQGAALSLRELLNIGLVLREIDGLVAWYGSCGGEENVLHEYFAVLKPEKALEERIENSILNEEELSDGASAELSRIRKAIQRQGARIKDQLDKLIKSETNRKFLQESLVTQRDGRYVVPVKSEYRGQIGGLVHDTSSSGATLFIEPMSVVEANNEIRILKREEQEEVERIIRELSAEVGRCGETLLLGIENALTLELYFAKANLGARMKGITPTVSEKPILRLHKARHPLIPSERVVPTTIVLGEEYTSLIITGPNTGGKTVALKTAGLLTLMAMCGLMIPAADDSVVGVFSRLLADIGDEQSIEQSLSTFSAHMTNIVRIMAAADERSLILLDELGSGTDPVEGAALAVSVLSYFRDVGSRVMATTHYQEVKMYAIEREGVENASCEFDVTTLKPTYRLVTGIPGKSNAFAIARRLGLSEDVIREAEQLVAGENKRFERVIESLEKTSRELEALKTEAERDARDAARLTEALREKEEALESRRESELSKARSQAMSIVEQTRSESERIMRELEDMRREKEKADFAERVKSTRSRMNSALNQMYDRANPVVEKKKTKYVLPRELRVGDTVRFMDIGNSGTVISLPDASGNCVVQVGMIKTRAKLENLELVTEQQPPRKKQSGRSVKHSVQSNMTRKSSLELDIRGMLTDEGILELDRFIDSCLMGGIEQITIIHGKGTGALRAAVHQFLKQHKNVRSYRLGTYGEGEAGVTVAELK